jgi:flagellar basal body-associated protein FliL
METAKQQSEWYRKHTLIIIIIIIIVFFVFVVVVVVGPIGIRPLKLDVAAESFKIITLIAFMDLGVPQD